MPSVLRGAGKISAHLRWRVELSNFLEIGVAILGMFRTVKRSCAFNITRGSALGGARCRRREEMQEDVEIFGSRQKRGTLTPLPV